MQSEEVRNRWAEQSGEYSPDYYAYYGPDETSDLLRARFDAVVGTDAAVLELGCSSGRHLAHLHDHGYEDLHGIDVNDEAFDVMADTYPELFAEGTFYADAIENAVRDFADGRFDAVYSVETLQHLHPDNEWVFGELVRITDDLLVTVENEGGGNESGRNESGGNEGGGDESGGNEGNESARSEHSDDRDVNYVNDEVPLYYRDWNRVFTERGLTEVEARSLDRDTFRMFRLLSDRSPSRRNQN